MVKEQVYEPDWRTEERTQYTINVADILADVAPEDVAPSIQTAPLGFKPRVTGADVVASYTEHVLRVVAHLVDLEKRNRAHGEAGARAGAVLLPRDHGRDRRLFHATISTPAPRRQARQACRSPISEAHGALRRHLGIVFDICHQAVEYEDIPQSLQKLVDAGIPIFKLQEAAALYVPE